MPVCNPQEQGNNRNQDSSSKHVVGFMMRIHHFAFLALAVCFLTFFGLDISAVTPLALPGNFFTLDVEGGFLVLVDLGRFVISKLLFLRNADLSVPAFHPLSEVVPRARGILQLLHDFLGDIVERVDPTGGEAEVQLLRLLIIGAAKDRCAHKAEGNFRHEETFRVMW
jgi:hypothetical protein